MRDDEKYSNHGEGDGKPELKEMEASAEDEVIERKRTGHFLTRGSHV